MPVDIRTPDGRDDLDGFVRRNAEEARARYFSGLAQEITRVLRRKRANIWPIRTGNSKDRFQAEAPELVDDVLVLNTAPYARFVNNRRKYPSGRSNPNYLAAQRTVEKHWDDINDRALRDV